MTIRPGDSPVRIIVRELSRAAPRAGEADLAAAAPLLRQAMAFLDRANPESPDTAGDASELAFLVHGLMGRTRASAFLKTGLECLLSLGFWGESLAAAFALDDSMPPEHVLALAGSLADGEKLLLSQAILRRPRPGRTHLSEWAVETLDRVASDNPDEVLIMLDLLSGRGDRPPGPVSATLLRGRLGIWLRQLLKMRLESAQVAYMAGVTAGLRSEGLGQSFARFLKSRDPVAREAACRAVAAHPGGVAPETVDLLAQLAEKDADADGAAALDALIRIDPPRAADLLADFLGRPAEEARQRFTGDWELAARVLTLPRRELARLVKGLAPGARPAALSRLFALAAMSWPERTRRCLTGLSASGSGQAAANRLERLRRELAAKGPERLRTPHGRRSPERRTVPGPETASLLDFFKKAVSVFQGGRETPMARVDPLAGLAPGGALRDMDLVETGRPGAALGQASFVQVRFEAVDFSEADLDGATFHGCSLTGVDFSRARLNATRFEGCRLDGCRFHGAALGGVHMLDCDLFGCSLVDVRTNTLHLANCLIKTCDFFGAVLDGLRAEACRLETVNLGHADLSRAILHGLEMADCCLDRVFAAGLVAFGGRVHGGYHAQCRLPDLETDLPDLLAEDQAYASRLLEAAALLASREDAAPPALDADAIRLAAAVIEALSFETDVRARRLAALGRNATRLAWAESRLGESGGEFLRLAPALIAAGAGFADTGFVAAKPAAIDGYHPDFTATRLLAALLGDVRPSASPPIPVAGIYSIGSLGSLAQTPASDLDVWVCLDDRATAGTDLSRFERKLEGLRRLAESRHGLEVHFFVMRRADIQANRFGFGDEESSGTAQGQLLKEEFYRTGLCLAGREPAWWSLPPGLSPEGYERAAIRLAEARPSGARVVDLGGVRDIDSREFFGAMLWTIVKSLKNPFKSVMKCGLLERYYQGRDRGGLLCDRIKDNIEAGREGPFDIDPYAVLLREVHDYYASRGLIDAAGLMRLAFAHKSGLDPLAGGAWWRGGQGADPFLEYVFALDPAAGPAPSTRDGPTESGPGGFAEVLATGDMIGKYLFGVYESLREFREKRSEELLVSDRDLTILGRRLMSRLARRRNKILPIPFIRTSRHSLAGLEISIEDAKDKKVLWTAAVEEAGPWRKRRGREVVRQEDSLPRLCGWLSANDIFRPGLYLKAGALAAPLALPDVQGLLLATREAFPLHETFEPPLSEGLSPERLTAALLVVNLAVPREERRIVAVELMYATNWGELYCLSGCGGLDLLAEAPFDFLRYNTGLECDALARLNVFTPQRAQCQRLDLSFYA